MQEKIQQKIQDAMHSIDGIQRTSPPPFFFTRLEARMQREKNVWEKVTSFVTKPSIALACICLVILVNAMVVFSSSTTSKPRQTNELATVDEYNQIGGTLYELENIRP